ncbi:Calnexin 1 [Tritrichomonas foetus]|uniref:Calnexin 1 n=1 Tax=Tritrichomonas foetus TaxID=1144522 RepID=A0A1J4J9K2_9EUKA|nr:Calnexin 1 [Tritrichomonas foetus]|eukprot:OHS94109.1 Calnexin 1 [Tritrichomonas foetus]
MIFFLLTHYTNSQQYGFLYNEHFDNDSWRERWNPTKLNNYSGEWIRKSDKYKSYLQMSTKNSFHGISTFFEKPITFTKKSFIIQYEVKSIIPVNCSGAYIKLFGPEKFNQDSLSNETNYIIMFGPDQCGDTNKIHFILKHWNPILNKYEEKQMIDNPIANISSTSKVFTLIIKNDNKFEIHVNGKPVRFGSLLNDFEPPINPPHQIDDTNDKKPEDWVDEEFIVDENAKKPKDWDENEPEFIQDPEKLEPPQGWLLNEEKMIPNPKSTKPEEWDENLYGKWEPEMIENPKCKDAPGCGHYEPPLTINPKFVGPWEPPMYRNPQYKGKWRSRKIVNPNYFVDNHPYNFSKLTGLGFDLWTVDGSIQFSNIILANDFEQIKKYNEKNYPQFYKINKNDKAEDSDSYKPIKLDFLTKDLFNPKSDEKNEEQSQNELEISFENLKNSWKKHYSEDPTTTLIITAVVIVFSIFTSMFCFK